MRPFQMIVVTPPGLADPSIAVAGAKAGGIGVLDLEYLRDPDSALAAMKDLARSARGDCGVKLDCGNEELLNERIASLPEELRLVILGSPAGKLPSFVDRLHSKGLSVLLECTSFDEAFTSSTARIVPTRTSSFSTSARATAGFTGAGVIAHLCRRRAPAPAAGAPGSRWRSRG